MSNAGPVRLSDIIDVVVFQDLPPVNSPEKTAFYESGVITRNPLLDQLAASPGVVSELPFWRDIDPDDAPNLSDDTNTDGATQKIVQGSQVGRKAFLNKGLDEMDLAAELAMGGDAMTRIRARIDTYWTRQWQRRLIRTVSGLVAHNLASDDGDMVFDATGATNAANRVFTRANFTSAAFTMGDSFDELSAVAVHSAVYKQMVDNDDIEFIPDSVGQMTIPTYLGHRVIVDDSLPVDTTSAYAPKFTSVIFGAGAVGWGEGTPRVPVEVDRAPEKGNGGGKETLWTRKTWLLHPFGYKVEAITESPAVPSNGTTFSLAELENPGIYDRVIDRKLVPMAFLITL
jgi:hypothetical protein